MLKGSYCGKQEIWIRVMDELEFLKENGEQ